jgi:DNA topoisomerase VI subunit A
MAKQKTPSAPARTTKERDAATEKKIVTLATDVAKRSLAGNEPTVRVPSRTKSNTLWNKK